MDYTGMREKLLGVFQSKEMKIKDSLDKKEWHALSYFPRSIHSNLLIKLSYPGYKSRLEDGTAGCDYRVEAWLMQQNGWVAISHVNILMDLFLKACDKKELEKLLYCWLLDLAMHGCQIDLAGYHALLAIPAYRMDQGMFQKIEALHQKLGKEYKRAGNARSYSISEASDLIPWVAMQEDMNYPMPRYEGRRMPFARYMEAVYCGAHMHLQEGRRISEVIRRALSHTRVLPWKDAKEIPYGELEKIVPERA